MEVETVELQARGLGVEITRSNDDVAPDNAFLKEGEEAW